MHGWSIASIYTGRLHLINFYTFCSRPANCFLLCLSFYDSINALLRKYPHMILSIANWLKSIKMMRNWANVKIDNLRDHLQLWFAFQFVEAKIDLGVDKNMFFCTDWDGESAKYLSMQYLVKDSVIIYDFYNGWKFLKKTLFPFQCEKVSLSIIFSILEHFWIWTFLSRLNLKFHFMALKYWSFNLWLTIHARRKFNLRFEFVCVIGGKKCSLDFVKSGILMNPIFPLDRPTD